MHKSYTAPLTCENERLLAYPSSTPTAATATTITTATTMTSAASAAPAPGASEPSTRVPLASASTPTSTTVAITTDSPSLSAQLPSRDLLLSHARTTWHACRPWAEFYSTRLVSVPSFSSLSDRIARNLHLYRSNYQVIAAVWLLIVVFAKITGFLLAAALLLLLERWCARRVAKNNGSLQHRDMIIVAVAALVVVSITGTAKLTLMSFGFSLLSVGLHAALHDPDPVETEIDGV